MHINEKRIVVVFQQVSLEKLDSQSHFEKRDWFSGALSNM